MTDVTLNRYVADHASGKRRRKRAVLYLRVSTPGQVNTDFDPEGISIPAQRAAGLHKAESLDADVVNEFVESGRSARDIDKRPRFQEMIAWVKQQGDVDYVIVYHFNRVFRNGVDAGVVKRDLKKYGTRVVSTILDMGETPESALVESIIHAVDQYQSEASGADIKYKMAQKVKNGGTVGQARLGYLNVRIPKPEGGEIRTIAVDPERSPFVVLAFELYATGNYGLEDLADDLYDRGLRTRATARFPVTRVSINKLSQMLRDRYYLGYVEFEGEWNEGRHDALITPDLFEQVQVVLNTRATAQERRRVHHHYLKGSLFCGRCQRVGMTSRMIIQRTVNRQGNEYFYFFCRATQKGSCEAPHIPIAHIEAAVETHYHTVTFRADFADHVRQHLASVVENSESATRLLRTQLKDELKALDVREDNLIDLAAGGQVATDKIKAKLKDIAQHRQRLTERLDEATTDLTDSAALIRAALQMLEDAYALYMRCDDEQRRLLNQALFQRLYVDEDGYISEHDLNDPFNHIYALQACKPHPDDVPTPNRPRTPPALNTKKAAFDLGCGFLALETVEGLLAELEQSRVLVGPLGWS